MTSSGADVLGLGDPADVHRDGRVDVDEVGGLGAGDQLVHVEDGGRVEHRAAVGGGEHGDGVRHALGGQRGAVDRVDGDVDLGAGAVADALAVEEHRGFVLLALADDDDAVHRDGGDEGPHGADGGAVGAVLVAAADPAARGHGGGLGDPDELQGEVAVGGLGRDLELGRQMMCSVIGAHLSVRRRPDEGAGRLYRQVDKMSRGAPRMSATAGAPATMGAWQV